MSLEQNKRNIFAVVQEACQSAGRTDQVTVLAVSKYLDFEKTQSLLEHGLIHLGENRADKFLEKYHHFQDQEVVWHYIGSLQRRKVKDIINYIDYFHSLDSLALAREIQKRASAPIKCFLQVNISGEESKHGFTPDELRACLNDLAELNQLEIIGLMTMAPAEASEAELHQIFAATRHLKEELQEKQLKNMPLTELSMGMSGDYPIAIAEGATIVRIGSAFFD